MITSLILTLIGLTISITLSILIRTVRISTAVSKAGVKKVGGWTKGADLAHKGVKLAMRVSVATLRLLRVIVRAFTFLFGLIFSLSSVVVITLVLAIVSGAVMVSVIVQQDAYKSTGSISVSRNVSEGSSSGVDYNYVGGIPPVASSPAELPQMMIKNAQWAFSKDPVCGCGQWRYVLGGQSPNTPDCSGFVGGLLEMAGWRLGVSGVEKTSGDRFILGKGTRRGYSTMSMLAWLDKHPKHNVGIFTGDTSILKPGDILSNRNRHVIMYVGKVNGKDIAADSSSPGAPGHFRDPQLTKPLSDMGFFDLGNAKYHHSQGYSIIRLTK